MAEAPEIMNPPRPFTSEDLARAATLVFMNEAGRRNPSPFSAYGVTSGQGNPSRQSLGIIQMDVPVGSFGEFIGGLPPEMQARLVPDEARRAVLKDVFGGPQAPGRQTRLTDEEVTEIRKVLDEPEFRRRQLGHFLRRYVRPAIRELGEFADVNTLAVAIDQVVQTGVTGWKKIVKRAREDFGELTAQSLLISELKERPGMGKEQMKRRAVPDLSTENPAIEMAQELFLDLLREENGG